MKPCLIYADRGPGTTNNTIKLYSIYSIMDGEPNEICQVDSLIPRNQLTFFVTSKILR